MGRNVDIGNSASTGLSRAYGCVDNVGLSARVRVGDELARVQPSVATIATNMRTIDERMAMLSFLTSSPESESPETSPRTVREPSDQSRPPASEMRSPSDPWRGLTYCPAYRADIRLEEAFRLARDSSHQPVFSLPVPAEGSGASGDARRARREDRDGGHAIGRGNEAASHKTLPHS